MPAETRGALDLDEMLLRGYFFEGQVEKDEGNFAINRSLSKKGQRAALERDL
ncbi:MAG: hypothetical protein M1269_13695 [Chloroflexi bacterium]|nr:hypothetical protein [Chloroflexota bacterium]